MLELDESYEEMLGERPIRQVWMRPKDGEFITMGVEDGDLYVLVL